MSKFKDYETIEELFKDALAYFAAEPAAGACAIFEDSSLFMELSLAKESMPNLTDDQCQAIGLLERELFEVIRDTHLQFHLKDPDVIEEDQHFREEKGYPKSHWWWYLDKIQDGTILEEHLLPVN